MESLMVQVTKTLPQPCVSTLPARAPAGLFDETLSFGIGTSPKRYEMLRTWSSPMRIPSDLRFTPAILMADGIGTSPRKEFS
ncbi:hypothetical protein [Haliangium ochraceum]|nr:hypothetical protein [Haliangium ochraceum]